MKLRDSVIARVISLRQLVTPIRLPLSPEDRRALAFTTIELDNLIIVGLRQYTKSSLLKCRTAAGLRVSAAVAPASPEEAAAFIYRSLNNTGYIKLGSPKSIAEHKEIVFRDPKSTEKVLIEYNASNLPNVALALSLNAQVFSELKVCRHFFAHRAKNTFEAVQDLGANLGIIGFEMPEHLMLRVRPGSGIRLLDGWLADVENFFDLAA